MYHCVWAILLKQALRIIKKYIVPIKNYQLNSHRIIQMDDLKEDVYKNGSLVEDYRSYD